MKTGKLGCQLICSSRRPGKGSFQSKFKLRGLGKEKDQVYVAQCPREGTTRAAELAGDGF